MHGLGSSLGSEARLSQCKIVILLAEYLIRCTRVPCWFLTGLSQPFLGQNYMGSSLARYLFLKKGCHSN
jgi:hypothetical protein